MKTLQTFGIKKRMGKKGTEDRVVYNCFSFLMNFSLTISCVLCTVLSDQTGIWDVVKVRRKVILQAVRWVYCCWEKEKQVLVYLQKAFMLGKCPRVISL